MNNLYFKCCLCEIETPLEDITSYKFKPLCRKCIMFIRNTTIIYNYL